MESENPDSKKQEHSNELDKNDYQKAPSFSENKNEIVIENPKNKQIKKYFMYVMIGGFIVSSLIAITAVLVGEFNEAIAKSLFTTLTIVIYSLFALAFMSIKHETKADEIVVDTLLMVTVVSLMASILGIWEVIDSERVIDMFTASFYAVIASAIIRKVLLYDNIVDKLTQTLSKATIGVTIFTYFVLMPSVFVNYPNELPEFVQRLTWATIILLVTMVVLTAISNKLYISQHPELSKAENDKPRFPTFLKVVIAIILIPLIISFISGLFGSLFYRPFY